MLLRPPEQQPKVAAQAWILIGGLEPALEQAGMMEALIEAIGPPRHLYTAGLATLGAVTLAARDGRQLRRCWERLRAGHALVYAALGEIPLLARLLDTRRVLARQLQADLGRRNGRGKAALLHLLAGQRYTVLAQTDMGGLLTRALERGPADAQAFATAIREAADHGSARILVLAAAPSLQRHMDITAAVATARKHGSEVSFILSAARQHPRLWEYLLPGLGAPERLWEQGRRAAQSWLERRA